MSSTYFHGGVRYTERQIATLCVLVKAPMPITGKLTKRNSSTLNTLADLDLVDLTATEAKITAEGRAIVIAMNAKVNGGTPKTSMQRTAPKTSKAGGSEPRRDSRERPAPTRGPSSESTAGIDGHAKGQTQPEPRGQARDEVDGTHHRGTIGVVDFDALRAEIVAHYEADLAACDRMREIAARIQRTA